MEAIPFSATPGTYVAGGPRSREEPPAGEKENARVGELTAECARLSAENAALRARGAGLEREIEPARKQAFEAGVSQGEQRALQELTPVVEKMKQAISDTVATRSSSRASAEKDVVQLAVQIAKRVLHRELATDAGALSALAKVVFDRMARAESYTLTVHPRFLEGVQAAISGSSVSKVRIEPDPNCAPGTFIVRSAEGTIDASLDTQLDEITRGLADRLAEN